MSERRRKRSRTDPAGESSRRPRRTSNPPERSAVSQISPVYLLREPARGRAAAGLRCNQILFMRLIGIADPHAAAACDSGGGEEWECPITDSGARLLVTATRHIFLPSIRKEGANDGLIFVEDVDPLIVRVQSGVGDIPQCRCLAHEKLKDPELSETESDDLKAIIRSAFMRTADDGVNYACGLLRRLFSLMGMPNFKAEKSGNEFGVSYVLFSSDGQRHPFRGCPDMVVHKEDIGAGRILVATGEIQSTRDPAVQNSIYAVGNLVENNERRPILCITVLKSKTAQLSIARLTPASHEEAEVMGEVSLKYVVSPSPMDLCTVKGLKTLATRLYHMLKA